MLQFTLEFPFLFIIGLVVVLSVISAEIQRRVGIPQVLGFILTGLVMGLLFPSIVYTLLIPLLPLVTSVALGFIGFNIGNEIQLDTVRRDAPSLLPVLLAESLGAFLLVFGIMYLWFHDLVLALLLGSLASATAPAATADVIWEYRSRGPVTDALMFILILDDAVAIILTRVALGWVILLLVPTQTHPLFFMVPPLFEIGLSVAIGALAGFILTYVLRRVKDYGRFLLLLVSIIILLIGLAEFLHISDILTCMVFGIVLSNGVPKETHELSYEAEKIFSPVILIFFVLFGAAMVDPAVLGGGAIIFITAGLYVAGRTTAKYLGSRLGARIGGSPPTVARYLGWCLLSQAGVAVGLSVVMSERLAQLGFPHYGMLIVGVIGISTLIFQIFGPLAVKAAIHRAGEANLPPETDYTDRRPIKPNRHNRRWEEHENPASEQAPDSNEV